MHYYINQLIIWQVILILDKLYHKISFTQTFIANNLQFLQIYRKSIFKKSIAKKQLLLQELLQTVEKVRKYADFFEWGW